MKRFLLSLLGAAAFALAGAVSDVEAQQPKRGGTLQFAISAETGSSHTMKVGSSASARAMPTR